MKLSITKKLLVVGTLAAVVGIGAGLGIGAGIFDAASTSLSNEEIINKAQALISEQLKQALTAGNNSVPTVDTSLVKLETLPNSTTDKQTVVLVTDAGEINDKSFNEQAYEAVRDIYFGAPGSAGAVTRGEQTRMYVKPTSAGGADIASAYTSAISNLGANSSADSGTDLKGVVVAPGFLHASGIASFQAETANASDTTQFIILDNGVNYYPDGSAPVDLERTVGITFDTTKAGFKAGYLSGLYLEEVKDLTPKVGTWGGGAFSGVTDFMIGFVAGIKYYNDNNGTNVDVTFSKFADDAEYTNTGFAAGGGRTRADKLLEEGVDIILPVAGPQTADALSAIKAAGKEGNTRVIGVDKDQSVEYSSDKNLFITSITKNVRKAAYEGYRAALGLDVSSTLGTETSSTLDTSDGNGGTTAVGPTGSMEFHVGLERGFTGYVKQFDTSATTESAKSWKSIYELVDAIPTQTMENFQITTGSNLSATTWANALAYIKAN